LGQTEAGLPQHFHRDPILRLPVPIEPNDTSSVWLASRTIGGRWEIAMLRGVLFLALVGGAGLSAWTSFQDSSRSPLDWAVSEVHAMVTQHDVEVEAREPQTVEAQSAVLQTETTIPDDRFTVSKETLSAITCGPWDVSDVGIEAILQEMIRRGWTPPSGAKALETSHQNGGIAEAIDSDEPIPAVTPPPSPVVSAETQSPAESAIAEASSLQDGI
jgi:hypothetical protein